MTKRGRGRPRIYTKIRVESLEKKIGYYRMRGDSIAEEALRSLARDCAVHLSETRIELWSNQQFFKFEGETQK